MITIIGNLVADPELRFTQSGIAVASFTVAHTEKKFDRNTNEWVDGDALFLRCTVWRDYAENVAASLSKGARVIVSGKLRQRDYETKEGQKRTMFELAVDAIGPDLRYVTATVHRVQSVEKPAESSQGWGGKQAAGWDAPAQPGSGWGGQPPLDESAPF